MDERVESDTQAVILGTKTSPTSGEVDALNPRLLTPQPMETLAEELFMVKMLAPRFNSINEAI
ncbi:hypothetical protein FRB91_010874 [Serendipita sp. 411]|nr:hypothetical protein FRB91_010874 [Serendipita sp. 411]